MAPLLVAHDARTLVAGGDKPGLTVLVRRRASRETPGITLQIRRRDYCWRADIGREAVNFSTLRLFPHAHQLADFAGGLIQRHPPQIGQQINHVRARVTRGEIRPNTGFQIDAETARSFVAPCRIDGYPLVTLAFPVWEPALDKLRDRSQ